MAQPMDDLISQRSLLFMKVAFPVIWVTGAVVWSIGVRFDPRFRTFVHTPWMQLLFWAIVLKGVVDLSRYHLPLKRVRMVEDGLLVSNSRTEIYIPFAAIENVSQLCEINFRYVVVRLREDTLYGRRFTFLPARPKPWWTFGLDDVVIRLRQAVESGRASGDPA
jgi:hypothetical protein